MPKVSTTAAAKQKAAAKTKKDAGKKNDDKTAVKKFPGGLTAAGWVAKLFRDTKSLAETPMVVRKGVLCDGYTMIGRLEHEAVTGVDVLTGEPLKKGHDRYVMMIRRYTAAHENLQSAGNVTSLGSATASDGSAIRSELVSAMYHFAKNNRQPLVACLPGVENPTSGEAQGVLRGVLDLRPSLSQVGKEHTVDGMAIIDWCGQHYALVKDMMVGKIAKQVDAIMYAARKLDRKNEQSEDSFTDDHAKALGLLHGPETMKGLINAPNWFDARAQLAAVCQTNTGDLLFGGCKEEVIAELLASVCQKEIETWTPAPDGTKFRATPAKMKESQRRVKEQLKSETLLQFYDEKRRVPLKMLGHDILCRFGSIAFEVDCRIWNPVREAALAQKLVPAVSVEWDLKHASFVPMDIEIDESMVKGFKEARKILVGELAIRKKTRQDVMSALKKVHESCRMRDPFWKMVEDYLTQLGEDHGCAVLEAEYWECFTDKATAKPKSLQQLAKDLPELKKTVLWSWVPEDKQDHLATGMEVIYQMSLGEPPKWHSPTDFLITLQRKLPDLCIHYNDKKGKAAMADMLKHTQDAGDVQYLSFLHLFRWAFSNEQQTQLDELTDKLMVDSDDDGAPSEESEGEKGASKKHASKNEAGGPAPKKMKANHQEGGSVSSSSGSCASPAPAKFDQNVMQKTLQYFSGAGSI